MSERLPFPAALWLLVLGCGNPPGRFVSNLFDKLGVWTRAQAIVFARDRGFGAS